MSIKKLLVNQNDLQKWLSPRKPEEEKRVPETPSILKDINNQRAAFRDAKKKGGAQIELFPTEGYVFSSKDMIELMEVWNGTVVLPKIVSVRGREKAIQDAMHDEFFRANWREGIRKVAASRFCRGHNRRGAGQRPWIATVDWFLQPHVLPRVIEGKYDNDKSSPLITPEDQKFLSEEL